MLKITAEEIHFIIYQYLHESGKPKTPAASETIQSLTYTQPDCRF